MPLCTGKIEESSKEGQMLTPLTDYTTHNYTIQCFSQRTGDLFCDLLVDTVAQVSVANKGIELAPYLGTVSVADGGQTNILGKWSTVYQIEMLALATDCLVANIYLQ